MFQKDWPVAEVDKVRSIGGAIPVSPQEFALIPRRVTITAPVKNWVLQQHDDYLTVWDPDVMVQQLVQMRESLNTLDGFVAALMHNVSEREQPPPPSQQSSGARPSGYQ